MSYKNTSYKRPHYYAPEELAGFWKADLLNDAEHSEKQAESGPFYPEKGITRETCLAYAAKCRKEAEEPIPEQFKYSKVSRPISS